MPGGLMRRFAMHLVSYMSPRPTGFVREMTRENNNDNATFV